MCSCSLALSAPGFVVAPGGTHEERPPTREGAVSPRAFSAPPGVINVFTGRSARQVSTMILPQVHLRKPCYDFSFL